jgi:hypothetical protein
MNSSFPISFKYSVSTTDFTQRSLRRVSNDELCACRNLEGGSHSKALFCSAGQANKKIHIGLLSPSVKQGSARTVFLNRRAAARYRDLASIIPGRDRFSWNLSF